jgi:predicted ribosomally synthesized peptide with nif11-like leader
MSEQSFQEFVKKLQQDAGLQKELRNRFGDPAAGIPIQQLAEFAAGKGYKFTVEELSGRLSDKQLDAVSGGAYEFYQKVFPKVEGAGLNQKVILNLSAFSDKH